MYVPQGKQLYRSEGILSSFSLTLKDPVDNLEVWFSSNAWLPIFNYAGAYGNFVILTKFNTHMRICILKFCKLARFQY